MEELDPIWRAKAIAAKLGGKFGTASELGKRSREDIYILPPGTGATRREKIRIPVDKYPGFNFLGVLFGPRGRTINALRETTGAIINVRGRGSPGVRNDGDRGIHPDDDEDLHVSIEGTSESVENAVREVEQILFNPDRHRSSQELENSSRSRGGSIDEGSLLSDYNSQSTSLTIYNGNTQGFTELEMKIPNNYTGILIGKGGEMINRLQSASGAQLHIPSNNQLKPGETTRTLTLKGTPERVMALKKMIEDILDSQNSYKGGTAAVSSTDKQIPYAKQQKAELENRFVTKVKIPNDRIGIIIGKQGMTVKGLQITTGANIKIPSAPDADDPSSRTILIGSDVPNVVEAAEKLIASLLVQHLEHEHSKMTGNTQIQLSAIKLIIPDEKVGAIIGKSGATVKEIQSKHNVKLQIPPTSDIENPLARTISIIGSPECQSAARIEIEQILGLTPIPQMAGLTSRPSVPLPSIGMGMSAYSSRVASGLGVMNGEGGVQVHGASPLVPVSVFSGSYQRPILIPPPLPLDYKPIGSYQQHISHAPLISGTGNYLPSGTGNTGYEQYLQPYSNDSYYSTPSSSSYTQQQQYQQAQPIQQQASTMDPTAYYNDYWQYAAVYGEQMARQYYGNWSPPPGTIPPPTYSVTPQINTQPVTSNMGYQSTDASQALSSSRPYSTGTVTGEEVLQSDEANNKAAWDEYSRKYAEWLRSQDSQKQAELQSESLTPAVSQVSPGSISHPTSNAGPYVSHGY